MSKKLLFLIIYINLYIFVYINYIYKCLNVSIMNHSKCQISPFKLNQFTWHWLFWISQAALVPLSMALLQSAPDLLTFQSLRFLCFVFFYFNLYPWSCLKNWDPVQIGCWTRLISTSLMGRWEESGTSLCCDWLRRAAASPSHAEAISRKNYPFFIVIIAFGRSIFTGKLPILCWRFWQFQVWLL